MTRGSLQDYVSRLRAGTPFALSRWGDGEWRAILGYGGATCDGQIYTRRLRQQLSLVLMSRPTYDLGLQDFAMRRHGVEIRTWLARRTLTIPWVDADVFAHASQAGELDPFLEALRQRRLMLVGPAHLAPLTKRLPIRNHLVVPRQNAFAAIERLVAEAQTQMLQSTADVLLVSAGPCAKVLIHRLMAVPHGHTVIDCGSLWEPYVGMATRTYHQAVMAQRDTLVKV